MSDAVERAALEPDFVQSLQGFAAMCESYSRGGAMSADDYAMIASKLRDAAFVIDSMTKHRDGQAALGYKFVAASPAPETPAPSVPDGWSCGVCGDKDVTEKWRIFGSCYKCAAKKAIDKRDCKIAMLAAAPEPPVQPAPVKEVVEALRGMLAHSCVADAGGDMKTEEDHEAERRARAALASLSQEQR